MFDSESSRMCIRPHEAPAYFALIAPHVPQPPQLLRPVRPNPAATIARFPRSRPLQASCAASCASARSLAQPWLMKPIWRIILGYVRHDFDQCRRVAGQGLAEGAAQIVGTVDPPGSDAEGTRIGLEVGVGQE